MKKYFFILAVVMAFVTGCNKNEDISPVSKNKTSPSSNTQPVRVLTDGMVDSIAMFHNLYLNTVVGDFDMNAPDELAELTSQFYTLGLISVGLDSNDVDFYLETIDHTNFIVEHSGNETVLQIMSDFQSFLSSSDEISYSSIQDEIEAQVAYANNNLVGSDLDLALVFLKVAENSAYFWMSQSYGGLGAGSGFLNEMNDRNPPAAIDWSAVVYADGAAAAGTLLRTWYAAGFGPLSWGAIVGAIGFGCAWGSGTSIFYQW